MGRKDVEDIQEFVEGFRGKTIISPYILTKTVYHESGELKDTIVCSTVELTSKNMHYKKRYDRDVAGEFKRRAEQCPFAHEHSIPENLTEVGRILKERMMSNIGELTVDLYHYLKEERPNAEIMLEGVREVKTVARARMKKEEKFYLMRLLGHTALLYEKSVSNV